MSRHHSRRPALRVGLISDVHAHLHHLHRALSILEAAGVDRVVCLGDVVEGGPHPDAVVELLERLCIPTVQGNHDLNAVRHAALEIDDRGMSLDTLAWLDALPRTRQYEWEGKRIAMAHASLGEGYPSVRPDDVPKCMRRALRSVDADVVLLGHTHVPMRFRWEQPWLCNPGSISVGRCGLGATCAILLLPAMSLEVYSMRTGELIDLGDTK